MRFLQQKLRFSWHCCKHQARVRAQQPQSYSHTKSFSTARLKLPAEELISSPANAFVKQCVRLRESVAYRQEQGFILIVGQTALDQLPASCQTAAHLSVDGSTAAHASQHVRRILLSREAMQKVTGLQTVPDSMVAAVIATPHAADFKAWPSRSLKRLLVLEGLQDPGNLGSLLRSAHALSWQGAFLLPGCCDPWNDKALKASRGAHLGFPLAQGTMDDLLSVLGAHGLRALAAAVPSPASADAQPSTGLAAEDGVALVLGSEGQGLSDAALQTFQHVSIPMQGDTCLNVAHAGVIFMAALSPVMPVLLGELYQQ